MESEHPVVEINITLLLVRKLCNLIDKDVYQQREKEEARASSFSL
jgi:hypothetical protein